MNRYLMFFSTSIHAHFVALLVALYSLYETRSDTRNIPSMLKLLRTNKVIEPTLLSEIEGLYGKAKPLWIKISVLRNEAFAHRSIKSDILDVFSKAEVTPDELRTLVEITKELLNKTNSGVFDTEHAFNLKARESTLGLLHALKVHHEKC